MKSEYAPIFARYGVGFVFLVFGAWQIINPSSWLGYLPSFALNLGINPEVLLILNGIFDLVVGLSLALGIFLRLFAVLGVIHLLVIELSLGVSDVTVRDVGLMIVLFSVLLHGKDKLCLKKN